MLKLPHRWCSRWKVIKWLQHILGPLTYRSCIATTKGYLFPLTTASISWLVYPFIVIRYVIIYTHRSESTLFPHLDTLSLSFYLSSMRIACNIHTCSARDHTEAFWLVSISLTVSNILMNMRPTSLPQNADKNSCPFTRLTL